MRFHTDMITIQRIITRMGIERIKNMKAAIRLWSIHPETIKIKDKIKKNKNLMIRKKIMNKTDIFRKINEIKEKNDNFLI
jgi:hypothetical protein